MLIYPCGLLSSHHKWQKIFTFYRNDRLDLTFSCLALVQDVSFGFTS